MTLGLFPCADIDVIEDLEVVRQELGVLWIRRSKVRILPRQPHHNI
jgi:hypothetical protein